LIRYEETFLPNVITIEHRGSARYVHITDGRSVLASDRGLAYAADERRLVITSKAAKMIGNEYLQDIELYDWPR
jgi:hypothetical protein